MRIVELRAQLLRAESRIDCGGGEIEPSLQRVERTARQHELHVHRARPSHAAARQLGEIGLSQAESDPDRGELIDRREQAAGRIGRDQRADRMLGAAADARYRSDDAGIRKIELGLPHCGARLLQRGFRKLPRRDRVVVFLARHRSIGDQGLQPGLLALRLREDRGHEPFGVVRLVVRDEGDEDARHQLECIYRAAVRAG